MNSITPIIHNCRIYYNRTQLRELGLSDQEIKDNFELQCVEFVDEFNYLHQLTLLADYENYIKFKKKELT